MSEHGDPIKNDEARALDFSQAAPLTTLGSCSMILKRAVTRSQSDDQCSRHAFGSFAPRAASVGVKRSIARGGRPHREYRLARLVRGPDTTARPPRLRAVVRGPLPRLAGRRTRR